MRSFTPILSKCIAKYQLEASCIPSTFHLYSAQFLAMIRDLHPVATINTHKSEDHSMIVRCRFWSQAGPAGFEPSYTAVKVLCLTAWRWANKITTK